MIPRELFYKIDPARALTEAQEIAREVSGLIADGCTPSFLEVDRLCYLVLSFESVTTIDPDEEPASRKPEEGT